jgi:cystathionine beta-lyase/cystathionine gamma-synthase
MLSLRLKAGQAATERFLDGLALPTVAPSLGTVETLVTLPSMTSHAGMKPEDRERLGLAEDLIRVSCGIESSDDLIADFARALEASSA